MHTLQEFFYQTKSVEYLIGVVFLLTFLYFYVYMFSSE